MKLKRTTLRACGSSRLNAPSSNHDGEAPRFIEHNPPLAGSKDELDAPDDLEHYDRLGVTRAILWSLAIAAPFWAVIRWLFSTR
jgi:hypothetical protein